MHNSIGLIRQSLLYYEYHIWLRLQIEIFLLLTYFTSIALISNGTLTDVAINTVLAEPAI